MNTLNLQNIVSNTSTNSEGNVLFNVFLNAQKENTPFILLIEPDCSLSSSFLNSSFGEFFDAYGMDRLKELVKIKANRLQFSRLKNYMEKYDEVFLSQ